MPKRILLADDSITIQKVVELTFSDGDYEVTAVNNGAKAIQKLSEMRPDIVLSDIIMPEKNGYEVCEYVKSHPEFRHLPVVLLTGTFEPFDPDRAEKAGCDAVVTKPFESQSLIQRVEELIAQSQQSAPASPSEASRAEEETPSPWMDEGSSSEGVRDSAMASESAFPSPESFTHDADIFSAAPATDEPTPEMPFDTPAEESPFASPSDSGETRALPRMTFDDLQRMAATADPGESAPPLESLPWDEQPQPAFQAETPSFPETGFEKQQQPSPESQDAPFGAPPPAEDFSGETRAFPRMSLEDLQQMAGESPAEPSAGSSEMPPASTWNEPEPPAYGGETRAFPKMTFDQLSESAQTPEPPSAPWLEQPTAPAFGEMPDFKEPAPPSESHEPELEALPWDTTPSWSSASSAQETTAGFSSEPASTAAEPVREDLDFAPPPTQEEPAAADEPSWSPGAVSTAEAEASEPAIPETPIAPAPPPAAAASVAETADLTDAQIERIARRVVEMMSEQVVRNIAWEVIPDMAEMVVKERIRQLESEG